LQTTKATPEVEAKPKGFAFLEYPSSHSMQHALKMHHTLLHTGNGKPRKINVELTAGGGGTSANRKAKLKAQNEKLNTQRTKKVEKLKEEKDKKKKEYASKSRPAPVPTKAKGDKKPWLSGSNAVKLG
jgi:nucleolar protein 6